MSHTISLVLLVIDTNVMFAAFDSPTGASRRILEAVLDRKVDILASVSLMLEYEDVLTRVENLSRFGLDRLDVIETLDELASLVRPVAFDFRWRPAAPDPDDDLVLETAINGGADAIASFNIRDLRRAAEQFGIEVERPAALLKRLIT